MRRASIQIASRPARPVPAGALPVILVGALAAACGGAPASPGADAVVAHVGDLPVSRGEVESYLAVNLLYEDGVDPTDPAATDRVKSRLFDALADQKRLLAEAARRRLQVSDREVDAHLATEADEVPVVAGLSREARRRLVRGRLTIRLLEDRLVERRPPLTDQAILAHVERARDTLASARRLRVRALRFPSAEDAAAASDRIRRGAMTFVDAVLTYETNPGQGVPLELAWETLSDELRGALGGLQPGETSLPVDFHGDVYLFQLEAWLDGAAMREEDLFERARAELERRRRRVALDGLLGRLRRAMPLTVDEERLPFTYIPDPAPDPT
jgi:hypothetical protein